jgi:hypothetical protein
MNKMDARTIKYNFYGPAVARLSSGIFLRPNTAGPLYKEA